MVPHNNGPCTKIIKQYVIKTRIRKQYKSEVFDNSVQTRHDFFLTKAEL